MKTHYSSYNEPLGFDLKIFDFLVSIKFILSSI